MKKTISIISFLIMITSSAFSQTSFELYLEKEDNWLPAVYELYIKEYADIDVDKVLIEEKSLASIYEVLLYEGPTETNSLEDAIEAVENGKKVFFFVETYVWGGLESGTVFSGSWQKSFPLCSGFYIYERKSFQNEGLNYHSGTKDNAYETKFLIFK
jgi:hypothetical protein